MSGVLDHEFARDPQGRMFGFFLFEMGFSRGHPSRGWFTEAEVAKLVPNTMTKRATWRAVYSIKVNGRHSRYEYRDVLLRIHYDPTRFDPDDLLSATVWDTWRSGLGDVREMRSNGAGATPLCNGDVFIECDPEALVDLNDVIDPHPGTQNMIHNVEFI